jgi:tRNA-dihydrouridine synthase 1
MRRLSLPALPAPALRSLVRPSPRLVAAPRAMSVAAPAPAPANAAADVPHAAAAWAWFRRLGAPRYWVAPMVDQSELAFRLLCLRHGADAAYTPMLHARLFLEGAAYRAEHFATTPGDRPLLAQFCANDPAILLAAAKLVAPHVDGVDINLGCPQRIAKKGRYGAFLMDDPDLVVSLVEALAQGLPDGVPVTVKIRRFDCVERTVAYAARLERAGASLVAIHGRTREQKRANECRAEWAHIAAVKAALRVPVLANGNVCTLADADACMAATGADGILSAESLLADPALFSAARRAPGGAWAPLDGPRHLLEYLDIAEEHPPPFRMMKGHAFKLLGPWLAEFIDLRQQLNVGKIEGVAGLRALAREVEARAAAAGRAHPVPAPNPRRLAVEEAAAAVAAAIAEQEAEEAALAALDARDAAARAGAGAVAVAQ